MRGICIGSVWVIALATSLTADDGRLGGRALRTATVSAAPPAPTVIAPAAFSLSVDDDIDLGGFAFKNGKPFIHNEGGTSSGNTAVGVDALASNVSSRNTAFGQEALRNHVAGSDNTAVGYQALFSGTSGAGNTAAGYRTLFYNDMGQGNSGFGGSALFFNTEGSHNTAVGGIALLYNETGHWNTAVGVNSIRSNTSGDQNTAVGYRAGVNWTTGDNNVAVGFGAYGLVSETQTIRVGGHDKQFTTYIEGINDAEVAGSPVCITASDELGLCPAPPAAQGGAKAGLSPLALAEIRRLESELQALKHRLKKLERER